MARLVRGVALSGGLKHSLSVLELQTLGAGYTLLWGTVGFWAAFLASTIPH